jgi:FkbM family methyltransferase
VIAFDAWRLPDGETHLPDWMRKVNRVVDGRLTYQYHKYEAAVAYCAQKRVALDVGAHVGLMSYWMARDFGAVFAFEPHPDHQTCWRWNMADRQNAALFAYALGAHSGAVTLEASTPGSSGDTCIAPHDTAQPAAGSALMRRLDDWPWPFVDFLKIDAEGYEYFILQGGVETLRRCKPVVMVEQKRDHGTKYGISDDAGVRLLRTLGYQVQTTLSGDVILTPGAAFLTPGAA